MNSSIKSDGQQFGDADIRTPSNGSEIANDLPQYVRPPVACALLNVTPETIVEWVREGKVRSVVDCYTLPDKDDATAFFHYNTAHYHLIDLLNQKFCSDCKVREEWTVGDVARLERVKRDGDEGDTKYVPENCITAKDHIPTVVPGWGVGLSHGKRNDGLYGTTVSLTAIREAIAEGSHRGGFAKAADLINRHLAQVRDDAFAHHATLDYILSRVPGIAPVATPNGDFPVDWPISRRELDIIALYKKVEQAMVYLANIDVFPSTGGEREDA